MNRRTNSLMGRILWRSLPLTYWMIGINAAVFVLLSILFAINPGLSSLFTLQAGEVIQGKHLWTLITSMFWHFGIFHLLVNMFSLFFLGVLCEQLIGRKRFLGVYIISGLFAAVFFVSFAYIGSFVPWGESVLGGLNVSAAGASGALFGILGVLVMLIPRHRVYLIAGPLIVIIVLVISAGYISEAYSGIFNLLIDFVIIFMIFSLFSRNTKLRNFAMPVKMQLWFAPIAAIIPLVIVSFFVVLPIGNSAHFGGLLAGLVYGTYLRMKYSNKIKMLGRMFR